MPVIRKMRAGDLPAVINIEEKSYDSPWTADMFRGELKSRLAHYYVAEKNDEIIGYFGLWTILAEGHITTIAVSPEHRGQGVGKAMMEKIIEIAINKKYDSLTLEVRKSNCKAINLYAKFGFSEVGLRKRYYQDNDEDAVIMTRDFCKGFKVYN